MYLKIITIGNYYINLHVKYRTYKDRLETKIEKYSCKDILVSKVKNIN